MTSHAVQDLKTAFVPSATSKPSAKLVVGPHEGPLSCTAEKTVEDSSCRTHSCFFTVLSDDGAHQVPPQPPQFDSLALHHPDAQPPPQLLDHLQQAGAGAGVVGAGAGVGAGVVGAGVGCSVVGAGVGGGAGVGEAGAVTMKSKHEMNCSGFLVQALKFGLFHSSFSSFRKVS